MDTRVYSFSIQPIEHQPGDCWLHDINDKNNFQIIDYSYINHECSICLTYVNDNIIKTKCGHFFCKKCIERWISKHNNCPMCRYNFYVW
jgi:hypothetical protein